MTASLKLICSASAARALIDAVRFEADFLSSGETLVIDVSADERFVLFLDGREIARCALQWFSTGEFGIYTGCCSYIQGASFPIV